MGARRGRVALVRFLVADDRHGPHNRAIDRRRGCDDWMRARRCDGRGRRCRAAHAGEAARPTTRERDAWRDGAAAVPTRGLRRRRAQRRTEPREPADAGAFARGGADEPLDRRLGTTTTSGS